jgi:hypothetical protein
MKLINHIQYWLGEFPLPIHIDSTHEYVLHLYDTPGYAYLTLDQIFKKIKVVAVIHNGNLIKELSITQHPNYISQYESNLHVLSRVLDFHQIRDLYICLGSEDHLQSLYRIFPKAIIFEKYGEITINHQLFGFAHDKSNLLNTNYDVVLVRNNHFHAHNLKNIFMPDNPHEFHFELIDTTTLEITHMSL